MNRRDLIKKTGLNVAIGAVALKAIPSFAQSASCSSSLVFSSEIGRNHGHAVASIKEDELILKAREVDGDQTVSIDIQGSSRHPHAIALTKENIVSLLLDGEIELTSTVDAGHSHSVTLTLESNQ